LSWLSEKVSREVDGTSCNGDGTSPVRDAQVPRRSDDIATNRLNIWWEIEMVTVTAEKILGSGGGVRVVMTIGRGTGSEVERLFEGFVTLSEGLFLTPA